MSAKSSPVAAAVIVILLLLLSNGVNAAFNSPTWDASCITNAPVVMTIPALVACMKSVPFPAARAYNVSLALQYALEIYSLRGWATTYSTNVANFANSLFTGGSETNSNAVTWISAMSEYEFNHRVTDMVLTALDRHVSYAPPSIFGHSFLFHPYVFNTRINSNGVQEMYISAWVSGYQSSIRPSLVNTPTAVGLASTFDITSFERAVNAAILSGVAIKSINGLDPITQWFPWQQDRFFEHEPNTNFNAALNNNFQIQLSGLPRSISGINYPTATTAQDTDSYNQILVMSDGSTINGVKLIIIDSSISVPASCGGMSGRGDADGDVNVLGGPNMNHLVAMNLYPYKLPKAEPETNVAKPAPLKLHSRRLDPNVAVTQTTAQKKFLIGSASGVNAYYIPSNNVFWIEIPTWNPSGDLETLMNSLVTLLTSVVQQAVTDSSSEIVFDMSGNQGGYLALVDATLQTLFPSIFLETYTFLNNNAVFKNWKPASGKAYATYISPYVQGTSNPVLKYGPAGASQFSTYFGIAFDGNMVNQTYNESVSWPVYTLSQLQAAASLSLSQEISATWWKAYKQNNVADYYTPYFDIILRPIQSSLDPTSQINAASNNPFTKVTVITDGLCGSACSQFETRVRRYVPNAKVITYGGWYSSASPPMQTSGYAGGTVTPLSCPVFPENYPFFGGYTDPNQPNNFPANYYPIEITTNIFHFYTSPLDGSPLTNTPRQYQSSVGDVHWKIWQPSFDQKVLQMYPNASLPGTTTSAASISVTYSVLALVFAFMMYM